MVNYKFTSLLEKTPLTKEDKYNLSVIFVAMKPERQIDIIEYWPNYLDKIVQLHKEAEKKKKTQLQETFSKINQIISTTKLKKWSSKKTKNNPVDPLAFI
jgi:phosphoribosylanthranilate isomerase